LLSAVTNLNEYIGLLPLTGVLLFGAAEPQWPFYETNGTSRNRSLLHCKTDYGRLAIKSQTEGKPFNTVRKDVSRRRFPSSTNLFVPEAI
jgi:hypothetical protein